MPRGDLFVRKDPAKRLKYRVYTQVNIATNAAIHRMAREQGLTVHAWFRMILDREAQRAADAALRPPAAPPEELPPATACWPKSLNPPKHAPPAEATLSFTL